VFVGPCADPRLRGVALAALLEAIYKFSKPTTENSAGTGTAETKLAEQPAQAPLWLSSGLILTALTQHFGDPVSVLVTSDRE
jgi:hypothetical protein